MFPHPEDFTSSNDLVSVSRRCLFTKKLVMRFPLLYLPHLISFQSSILQSCIFICPNVIILEALSTLPGKTWQNESIRCFFRVRAMLFTHRAYLGSFFYGTFSHSFGHF